jgi:uncharacterized protein YndB with AHSA1/START domain
MTLVLERIFNAPVDKIWKALTDKDEMKKWYFSLEEFRAEPGFEFRFYGEGHNGERYLHICTVTEAEADKKLSYSWTYDNMEGHSLVSFELFPEGNKTMLRPDFAKESFTKGWTEIIGTSLLNYLNS